MGKYQFGLCVGMEPVFIGDNMAKLANDVTAVHDMLMDIYPKIWVIHDLLKKLYPNEMKESEDKFNARITDIQKQMRLQKK